ncbi:SpoIVB peptidase S55 domain-containing protein [Nocardioides psychrotolerans]|uniref:SpoIVB peptidase S55 domain-containing protein n=1 Tax=Nocardioides psychrotolerans TaxID=1005945 RepID=UPI003137E223
MPLTSHRRPGRHRALSLAALATTTGMLVGVTATGPATSAEPAGDCTAVFPVAEVAAGQLVEGLTVDSGVTPEPFTGEVLGVLEGGIAPGLDMIIMDLDSPAIQAAGGIWQGMSGSPVYADDGRLIGAVAYGLAFGSSPVAGITPFEDMDDYLDATARPGRITIDKAMAQRIARESDASAAEASHGFRQLPMPLGVSGVNASRLDSSTGRPYLTSNTYAVGKATGAAAPTAADIVAGGNIASSLAYGDITAAGVGTATSVCDGRVVGFGHPMQFSGPATMSMHPADAIYVQEEPLGAPFKVANIAAPVGTITDDRLTGITGTYGPLPDAMTVTSTLTKGDTSRTGVTDITVPLANAELTFYQLVANHDRVIDGITGGTESQTWTITGTDADGTPFTLEHADRFTSIRDITYESSFDLPDVLFGLSQLDGVTVTSATAEGDVTDGKATYTLGAVQQYRQGAWVTLSRKEPALAVAGKKLLLRQVLNGPSGQRTVPVSFTVPARAAGQRGSISMTGGNFIYSEAAYQSSLAKILKAVREQVRNDEVQADLSIFGRKLQIQKSQVLGPVDMVVNGNRRVRVVVR